MCPFSCSMFSHPAKGEQRHRGAEILGSEKKPCGLCAGLSPFLPASVQGPLVFSSSSLCESLASSFPLCSRLPALHLDSPDTACSISSFTLHSLFSSDSADPVPPFDLSLSFRFVYSSLCDVYRRHALQVSRSHFSCMYTPSSAWSSPPSPYLGSCHLSLKTALHWTDLYLIKTSL